MEVLCRAYPGGRFSRIRLARTRSLRGIHWLPSLAAELGLSSVRRCYSVVGFPQAVLLPSSGPWVRQGPFAPRELPRFLATMTPSDSRLGRQAVMVSRRSLIRITDHQAGSLRFLVDLSTPAVPYHPEEPDRCMNSLLHGRFQASPFPGGWPLPLCVTRPKGSLALRLTSLRSQAPTNGLPRSPPSRLHGERASAMASTFQLTRSTKLRLTHRKARKGEHGNRNAEPGLTVTIATATICWAGSGDPRRTRTSRQNGSES